MTERLKVVVTGSREWDDEAVIAERLDLIPFVLPFTPHLIHGNARGADRLAAKLAKKRGFMVEAVNANWDVIPGVTRPQDIRKRPDGTEYDAFAGKRRNLEMLDRQPHVVFAFQKDDSGGTQHTIDEAQKRGIKVEVYKS